MQESGYNRLTMEAVELQKKRRKEELQMWKTIAFAIANPKWCCHFTVGRGKKVEVQGQGGKVIQLSQPGSGDGGCTLECGNDLTTWSCESSAGNGHWSHELQWEEVIGICWSVDVTQKWKEMRKSWWVDITHKGEAGSGRWISHQNNRTEAGELTKVPG